MRILFWLKNSRYVSLPQSMLPALTAIALASSAPTFNIWWALIALLGVAAAHLGMNLADDYFDYLHKGTAIRNKMAAAGIRARIAKCDYLVSGEATLPQLAKAILTLGSIALVLGAIIYHVRGIQVVYLTLAGVVLGYSYSGSPLKLSYRGLGELVIGIMFGPLLMAGVYLAAAGSITSSLYFISIPVGLLVMNVVYTHSIMDFEPDKSVGKYTLAVLLKRKGLMLALLALILFLPFLIIVYGIVINLLPLRFGWVCVLLPMAIWLFYLMIEFVQNPQRKFKRHPLMGPMQLWDDIEKSGIDWFMIRWYMARNLLSLFCLLIAIISLFK